MPEVDDDTARQKNYFAKAHPHRGAVKKSVLGVPWQDEEETRLAGYALLIVTAFFTSMCIYGIVISKLLPNTGDALLDAVADDYHYCVLVPLTVPVALIAVYWNWVSMKFFRHN